MTSLKAHHSNKSIATGFAYSDDQFIRKHPHYLERSLSVPRLPSHDFSANAGFPPRRPSKFFSANHSFQGAKTYHPRPYFRSRRIRKGTIDRPELRMKDPRDIWITLIPIFGIVLGLTVIGLLAWTGWVSVDNYRYCEVFVDDFANGFNSSIWTKSVETGGFG